MRPFSCSRDQEDEDDRDEDDDCDDCEDDAGVGTKCKSAMAR